MGLYLCVFDGDTEIDGVEVGSYADFNMFRDAVTASLEGGQAGSKAPILIGHSDCDGSWSSEEAAGLIVELGLIEKGLMQAPPIEFNSPWKTDVAKTFGISPRNLLECFFDVDGEPLVVRLIGLARFSVSHDEPILFQ